MECMQVEDAWICSACLRLVNGNPGPALASKLGWTAPLAAPTLAAQLLELSRLAAFGDGLTYTPSRNRQCHLYAVSAATRGSARFPEPRPQSASLSVAAPLLQTLLSQPQRSQNQSFTSLEPIYGRS